MSVGDVTQFVDANVLIYAHDLTAGTKRERARSLVADLWRSELGCVSVQVLQEFYVNVTRKLATPLTPDAAAKVIADLATWQVHQPTADDLLDAIHLQTRHKISFWDAMILASAQALRCEVIWSEDLRHEQRYDTVTVRNPFI
ncbi:MAG: PIN domain-containing protein [Chloroflexi bacterium]|nr:PIN domain-containing protein [Chloroflexota bacterium]